MRQVTIFVSIAALFISVVEPAFAGNSRKGVPGRRVGGGTRISAPRLQPLPSPQNKLSALAFASRNNLPMSLKLKVLYG